jgi:iron complex outermembrane receptor protein
MPPRPFLAPPRAAALAACLSCVSLSLQAQTTLPEVVVTGNPLGSAELATPATVLREPALGPRRASTLGEALDGLPGISQTGFGPNASRPVIRGLDGDRIRILRNGAASFDASSLSFDHAVPLDPLVVDRIEVLRGPAALMFGGQAVGGVVNLIDNRIPRTSLSGVQGRAELRSGGAASEQASAVVVEGGTAASSAPAAGGLAWHVDAFQRRQADLRIPVARNCNLAAGAVTRNQVCNSSSDADGGAVGASVFFDRGYAGLSAATQRNFYGTPAEADVRLRMRQVRQAFESQLRLGDLTGGWLERLSLKASQTDYRHTELDRGNPATTFTNQGRDLQLEATHAPVAALGGLRGAWGVNHEDSRFAALGDEAFIPRTRSRQTGVFLLEELPATWGKLSLGLRLDRVSVSSQGGGNAQFVTGDPQGGPFTGSAQFGTAVTRHFTPRNLALGAAVNLAPAWQAQANLAYAERAPTYYELFANGVHAATNAFEVGDRNLGLERSVNLDLGLKWRQATQELGLSVYRRQFRNFIALAASGNLAGVPGEVYGPNSGRSVGDASDGNADVTLRREFRFQAVPALFEGLELEGRTRVWAGAQTLDLDGSLDLVRATNTANGQPLPRIAPLRLRLALVHAVALGAGQLTTRLEVQAAAPQNRFAAFDARTPGHALWHLGAVWRMQAGPATLNWFARLQNLTNRTAFNAVASENVRQAAPLGARALSVGLQAAF